MINPGALFDDYGRKARLYPSLLTGLPLVATIAAWIPAVADVRTSGAVVGVATAAGFFYWLASLTRTAGKRTQKRLLSEWGGWPTTIMLRHRNKKLPSLTRARYHAFLAERVDGLQMPTAEEEEHDPGKADETYVSAVWWLKEQRRGPEFSLILKELAEYGFRRNLLALKPVAIVLCVIAIIGWSAALLLSAQAFPSHLQAIAPLLRTVTAEKWASLAFVLLALVGWVTAIRGSWVREAGDDYARALLASCDAQQVDRP